jgi:hypothetical protein
MIRDPVMSGVALRRHAAVHKHGRNDAVARVQGKICSTAPRYWGAVAPDLQRMRRWSGSCVKEGAEHSVEDN